MRIHGSNAASIRAFPVSIGEGPAGGGVTCLEKGSSGFALQNAVGSRFGNSKSGRSKEIAGAPGGVVVVGVVEALQNGISGDTLQISFFAGSRSAGRELDGAPPGVVVPVGGTVVPVVVSASQPGRS